MSSKLTFIISISLFIFIHSDRECKLNENFCESCNVINNLCEKCLYSVMTPDENGGCVGKKKCTPGKNYCTECDSDICQLCETGYFPDENGGCSFSNNCEISENGFCLKCNSDYILTGNNFCKYLNSEDFTNCKNINQTDGKCEECNENYFLGEDKKCSLTENCKESIYGICDSCKENYYLNKLNDECLSKNEKFKFCKITIDGNYCDECDDNYFLSENKYCVSTNNCEKGNEEGLCLNCLSDFHLVGNSCAKENNCNIVDDSTGLCTWCENDFYLDSSSRKCISNLDNEKFAFCKIVLDGYCNKCEKNYYLGEDKKCSLSENCLESKNGVCISCINENYHLGLDSKCINVEKCIYSNNYSGCTECENGYYYNTLLEKCILYDENFQNCKSTSWDGKLCGLCKKNYYMFETNGVRKCYNNQQKGNLYKCRSSLNNETCNVCEDDYYLGNKDNLCTKIEGCAVSKDENTCVECDDYHCLNAKNGKCEINDVVNEDNLFYFRCKKTNENGDKCAECLKEEFKLENGICIDNVNCEESSGEYCSKCEEFSPYRFMPLCLNKNFGCVETIQDNCLKCDDADLFKCTECKEGYTLTVNNTCVSEN